MVLIKTLRDVLMRDNARRQVKKQLMLQTSCIFYNMRQKKLQTSTHRKIIIEQVKNRRQNFFLLFKLQQNALG
jgi:hypothetical protein